MDLVVLCDAAPHLGGYTVSDLEQTAGQYRRGAPMLRRVLPWVDGRSESAWETLLRMLHLVCDVSVEPQFEVYASDIERFWRRLGLSPTHGSVSKGA